MSQAGSSQRADTLVLVVSACRFSEAIAVGMMIPILPVFLGGLQTPLFGGLTNEELTAILYSATGFVMAAAQVASMVTSDRLDRRKALILLGLSGATLCGFSYLTITSFWQLLAVRMVQGICLGFTFPPLMAILSFLAPAGKGGRTLGTYSTIRLFGFATGPVVGGYVSEFGGLQATFLTSAVLLVISTLAVAIWVPEVRERITSRARDPLPPIHASFYILGSCVFIMMIGISGIISLFPFYQTEFGATPGDLGWVFSAFIGTRCLFQYPLGWLGDYLEKKRVLIAALLLFIPIVALQGYAGSIADVIGLRIALGVVSSGISVTVGGISAERSEPGNRARVMGVNTVSFSLGVAIGPILGGFLTDPPNVAPAFLWPAGFAALVLIAVCVLVPSDRRWSSSRALPPGEPEPEQRRNVDSGEHVVEQDPPASR